MEEKKLLQTFAVNKEGELVSVMDVQRGKACDCCCPVCGEVVIAKQGEVRVWHFAHESGSDCEGAAEGALHLAAKQLLLNHGRVLVPSLEASVTQKLPDGRQGHGHLMVPGRMVELLEAQAEVPVGNVRPDVMASAEGRTMFIEVAVTHLVDEAKRDALKVLGVPTMEIQLDPALLTEWTWDTLAEVVLSDPGNRAWVYHPDQQALIKQAEAQAILNANQQPSPNRHEIIRMRLRGVPVHIHNRGWGLTVWNPYSDEVNPLIKAVVRHLGGRWKPEFRNWTLPVGVQSVLIQQLKDLGAVE